MTLHHTFTLWVIYFSNFTSVRVLRNCLLLEYNYNSDVTNSHWLECLSSLGHAEFFRLRTSSTSSSFLLSDIHQAEKSYYKFYVVHLVSPPFFFYYLHSTLPKIVLCTNTIWFITVLLTVTEQCENKQICFSSQLEGPVSCGDGTRETGTRDGNRRWDGNRIQE